MMALGSESFLVQDKGKENGNVSFVQHEPKDLGAGVKDTPTSRGIDDSVWRSIQSVLALMGLYFCSSCHTVQDKS